MKKPRKLTQALDLLREFVKVREAADHASSLTPPFQASALNNISIRGEELIQKARELTGLNPRDMDVQLQNFETGVPITDEQKGLLATILDGDGVCAMSGTLNGRNVAFICLAFEEREGGDILVKPLGVILDEAILHDPDFKCSGPDGLKLEELKT